MILNLEAKPIYVYVRLRIQDYSNPMPLLTKRLLMQKYKTYRNKKTAELIC